MAKSTTACAILCLVLFATFILAQESADARPVPTSQSDQAVDEVGFSCEGLGEDECLERRTLAAHIDYIYTQNKPKD